jgi:hypothetical protein
MISDKDLESMNALARALQMGPVEREPGEPGVVVAAGLTIELIEGSAGPVFEIGAWEIELSFSRDYPPDTVYRKLGEASSALWAIGFAFLCLKRAEVEEAMLGIVAEAEPALDVLPETSYSGGRTITP